MLTWAELHSTSFFHNSGVHKSLYPEQKLAVVVKSNAYGHGMKEIVSLCQQDSNINYVCTVSLSEAIQVRTCGFTKPLLVLSYCDAPVEEAIKLGIELTVINKEEALKINRVALGLGKKIQVHIKIDTGLMRFGIRTDTELKEVLNLPGLELKGIYTHCADRGNPAYTQKQMNCFNKILQHIDSSTLLKHITFLYDGRECESIDMMRAGLGIYGIAPVNRPSIELKPVLQWKAKIVSLKNVSPETSIGYGCSYIASRSMKIALIPVGYADGYPYALSNKGHVMVNNMLCPIIGRVAMNSITIDVSTCPHIKVGDEVSLIGVRQKISVEHLVELSSHSPREILTRLNSAIPRIIK